jgi:flagellar hook-basal body complex protein FliE
MTDPLGLIGRSGPISPGITRPADSAPANGSPGFKEFLEQQIHEVNQLQQDASQATNELIAGRRSDVESVMVATQKADTAFRMLLQVRNKMMDVYEEVKQLRV